MLQQFYPSVNNNADNGTHLTFRPQTCQYCEDNVRGTTNAATAATVLQDTVRFSRTP